MAKKGLGRGLGALMEDNDTTPEETLQTDGSLIRLSLSDIEPNRKQARKEFDETALAELADSISEHGLLEPIVVRRKENGYYEIIAGERRWRAAILAGCEKIPCVIREADRGESAELALVENIQRSDLGPFEEAEAIRNLLLMTSMTQVELSAKLSLSPSALSNKLRLLKLSDSDRRLISEYGMGERHARAFLKLADPEQRRTAILRAGKDGLSASETERLVELFCEEQSAEKESVGQQKKEARSEEAPRRIAVIRDVRFFFNTIDRATALLREAGFSTEDARSETDEGYEIRIFVPKARVK